MLQPQIATVRREFAQIDHLPPLSQTATRLLQVAADPDIEVDELAGIIELDPGLSARILGLANSAYFGQRQPINAISDAMIRVLGLNMVKSLAMSIAVAGTFETSSCSDFDLEQYWYTALGCAQLARQLAVKIPLDLRPDLDSVYLCGLLHNLGSLLLAHVFPEQMGLALRQFAKHPEDGLCAIQRETIGSDFIQAGEWLVRRWHLPEAVVEVVGALDDAEYRGDFRLHLLLTRNASNWIQADPDTRLQLAEDQAMLALDGITAQALAAVEERFVDDDEELKSMARVLLHS